MQLKIILSCISCKIHLITGYDNIMRYHVTVRLRLRECYQAVPLEPISVYDWLHTDIGHANIVLPVLVLGEE